MVCTGSEGVWTLTKVTQSCGHSENKRGNLARKPSKQLAVPTDVAVSINTLDYYRVLKSRARCRSAKVSTYLLLSTDLSGNASDKKKNDRLSG